MGWQGPLTHRQYRAWEEWVSIDMGQPGKSEFYQMQTSWAAYYAMCSEKPPFKSDQWALQSAKAAVPAPSRTAPASTTTPGDDEIKRKSDLLKCIVAARFGVSPTELGVDITQWEPK